MNVIKRLRKERGLSQQDLAKAVHVHQTAVSQWETGRHFPDMKQAIELASYFNVTTDYLLGNTDDPTPPDAKKERPSNESVEEALVRLMMENNIIDESFTMSKRDALRALEALKILTEKDDNTGD